MTSHLRKYWDFLRSSFWFLPSVMTAAAAALAFAAVALDRLVTLERLNALGWVYTGGAEGASVVLGTIAGSMIAIAGVVFSMTLVALSLASSQLGPRLLRSFMRDTSNQAVLGTFIASFVYCLLVLRTIRRADEVAFVPHLSVTLGVVFAIVGLGVLIYFIHHVSVSIQADEVIGRVADEIFAGIERLFPAARVGRPGGGPDDSSAALTGLLAGTQGLDAPARDGQSIMSAVDGYLQYVDLDTLRRLAEHSDATFRIERRPGHYLVRGRPLVTVWPAGRIVDGLAERINAAFTVGNHRTATQDVEFSILQLVEIAVRALSPGINDPFTAIACVDRIGSGLCRLAMRDMPARCLFDAQRALRVITPAIESDGIIAAAFQQIRDHSRASAAVNIRLLETIAVVAEVTHRPEDISALRRQAEMIASAARESVPAADDRRAVEDRFQAVIRTLEDRPS